MPGLEESDTEWRYRVADPESFDKFRTTEITDGVSIIYGHKKGGGDDDWDTQAYRLKKSRFKDRASADKWLKDNEVKAAARLAQFKAGIQRSKVSLKWGASIHCIKAEELHRPLEQQSETLAGTVRMAIRGRAVDDTTNANGWRIDAEEMESIAKQLIGSVITVDHGDKVRDAFGRVTNAWVEGGRAVDFEGWVASADPALIVPLQTGLIDAVSIEANAESERVKSEGSDGKQGKLVQNVIKSRISYVLDPAYEGTKVAVECFTASVNKAIAGVEDVSIDSSYPCKVCGEPSAPGYNLCEEHLSEKMEWGDKDIGDVGDYSRDPEVESGIAELKERISALEAAVKKSVKAEYPREREPLIDPDERACERCGGPAGHESTYEIKCSSCGMILCTGCEMTKEGKSWCPECYEGEFTFDSKQHSASGMKGEPPEDSIVSEEEPEEVPGNRCDVCMGQGKYRCRQCGGVFCSMCMEYDPEDEWATCPECGTRVRDTGDIISAEADEATKECDECGADTSDDANARYVPSLKKWLCGPCAEESVDFEGSSRLPPAVKASSQSQSAEPSPLKAVVTRRR